ncbi:hypothetical protein BU23DRAFT_91236 [Bimuria novae-zelandiae CBS 107.79]|uniref:RRM domain-containing protein n=1 Tax=Bimuria novae-zelandiae CBS 107.79 TaxID=1447943 RepID=A0A6A5VDB5_9PLEO|nr:hypothetical protein BU23DRAFT_91236 [Bimuria novae-zelandiae CBS 107.79]
MSTVTIGKSYFDALLRRAEFHTSGQQFDTTPSLSNNVTISKAEHDYLLQAVREYNLLKSALFRGGLTTETLDTLLAGEGAAHDEPKTYATQSSSWEETFVRPNAVPVIMSRPHTEHSSPTSDNTTVGEGLVEPRRHSRPQRVYSYGQHDPFDTLDKEEEEELHEPIHRVPVHDQRTVLITNLSDRTAHKDLACVVRGGRLLDIFLRNDRSATVSFVEGAAEFLAYAKRNDIYLHTKRLEFRWNDRQFHVPPHVANKIANGASRNLVVRGAVGKFTADQIRDHLDHIHNLVVVDIFFRGGDAYISTNSIHNALFARTCMMSRTAYKGLRIDWYPDECAAPLPRPMAKTNVSAPDVSIKPMPMTNRYTLLDTESELESESEEGSYMTNGIGVSSQWADAAVA